MLFPLFLFISGICCFPLLRTQKPFECCHSIQFDMDISQGTTFNNIPIDYGYISTIETPSKINADIPIKHPLSGKEENATLILTRIEYDLDSIRLFGRPSKHNLHQFQSISTIKSIQFGTYSIDMSAHKWFQRLNAGGISTQLINKHTSGSDVELELAPLRSLKNEYIELKDSFGATKQRFVWSGPNKLECNTIKQSTNDPFYEIIDSAIVF